MSRVSLAQRTVAAAMASGREQLEYDEAFELLRAYDIPAPPCVTAATRQESIAAAASIGFPVALKISSSRISHKSDVGGVLLGLSSADDLGRGFDALSARMQDDRHGDELFRVTVQAMAKPGLELIIGIRRDPQFGPVIMLGLGGVLTELLCDISLRVAPLEESDAHQMMGELRGAPLMTGFRGSAPTDTAALAACLMSMSRMAGDLPELIEADFNPLLLYPRGEGLSIVDARIRMAPIAESSS